MSENQNQRKYDWIEYEDGTRLGRKTTCPSKRKMINNFIHKCVINFEKLIAILTEIYFLYR